MPSEKTHTASHEPGTLPEGSRRSFFQWVTKAVMGLIGVGLAVPLVGYVISPALKRREQTWVDVGGADEGQTGEPSQREYIATIRDGYVETKSHKAVWALKQSEGQVVVFSPMCTHLGCGYTWDATERKFKCPCHGSGYDSEGINFEGPAPRPMDRAKVTLDAEGQIVVDTGTLFEWPKGEKSEFDDDGAFIRV